MAATIDSKTGIKLTFKDAIYIVMIAASVIGTYFNLDGRLNLLESRVGNMNSDVVEEQIANLKDKIDEQNKKIDKQSEAIDRIFDVVVNGR